jgi:hypothetical protein
MDEDHAGLRLGCCRDEENAEKVEYDEGEGASFHHFHSS